MKLFVSICCMMLFVFSLAQACSCSLPTVDEAYASADAVFTGTVYDLRLVGEAGNDPHGKRRAIVTFLVSASFKGDKARTVVLHTTFGGIGCDGFQFQKGKEFLVYAKRASAKEWLEQTSKGGGDLPKWSDQILGTSECWRTMNSSTLQAQADLHKLHELSEHH